MDFGNKAGLARCNHFVSPKIQLDRKEDGVAVLQSFSDHDVFRKREFLNVVLWNELVHEPVGVLVADEELEFTFTIIPA